MNDGWEKLFLSEVDEEKENGMLFYGHELSRNKAPTRRSSNSFFDTQIRKSIIHSLIDILNQRFDYDSDLQEALQPLASITSMVTRRSLKLCYETIIPDLDENEFYVDFVTATNLLKNHQFNKVKANSRSSLCGLSLFNYLYIKLNVDNVEQIRPN